MHLLYTSSLLSLLPYALGRSTPKTLPQRDDASSTSSCSATSFDEAGWTIEDFDYHASYVFSTPAHQNSWGYASFNLTNPAVPDTVASCSASSDQLEDFFYGTVWYDCAGSDAAPATFAFSRPSGELDINQTWVCDDEDPQYPTTFTAYGKINLTLDCTETTYQNENWTIGQIYSDREVTCAPVSLHLEPYEMTGVA
ncbi:hypothetical protein M406DRAFT_356003 [Cryphonectria parasitica EP155]|uniref:AA1-like domain-containing protein n=1 Tax=Cryphonectria parasitica (strain ATCC 38755 / EP155) TaxID=660469 RepID=A0A9P5CPX9_CRYP1|nr:uncharacterized protein M406DRAFT_356003 [Cryphonectria parasitica EP155]KAF3765651.1 hypothetical protein M406DRAFT_356003 [Cryphonectria parasitica EP155]